MILLCSNFYLRLIVGLSVFTFLHVWLRNADPVIFLSIVIPTFVTTAMIGKIIQDIFDWVQQRLRR